VKRHRGAVTVASFEERLAAAYMLLAQWQGLRPPVDVADQAEAAARDALELVRRIGAVEELRSPGRLHGLTMIDDSGHHRRARILAAVLACSPCWHVRNGGPQPAVVSLPTRRIDCLRCAGTQRRPVIPDDTCDVCDEPVLDNTFWPVLIQLGVAAVGGDMCRTCAAVINPSGAT
jgi:hypothetical protein